MKRYRLHELLATTGGQQATMGKQGQQATTGGQQATMGEQGQQATTGGNQAATGVHILSGVLPGSYLSSGGLAFCKPGERSHTNDGPDGRDYHVHTDCEAFLIVQGTGTMELDGAFHPVAAGDIIVVEPGEDHHLISSMDDPIVTLWCHAGPARHKNQQ